MDTILIVDGSALLFQSFFGMPNKIVNSKGENIEAVICFVGILNKTIKALNPNKLIVVFDGENELERKTINQNYKANRVDYSVVDSQDNPYSQLPKIKQVLNYLGYAFYETETCEADDYIASLVNNLKDNNKIIISSADKDFYQLISLNVSVFTYRGKVSKLVTETEILNNYGFESHHFTTFKALTGDVSDNILGIKGIGPKTASNLICKFGTLENIILNATALPEKLKNSILQSTQLIRQNYKIIDLKNSNQQLKVLPTTFKPNTQTTMQVLSGLKLN